MSGMSDDWIAYVGPFPFPEGNASARRVLGLARSIAVGGLPVVVVATYLAHSKAKPLALDGSVDSNIWFAGTGEYAVNGSPLSKAARLFWTGGSGTIAWLESQPRPPAAVIAYGTVFSDWRRLLAWCRRASIPLIGDIVDWYTSGQMPGGPMSFLANEYTLRHQVPLADGVICVSRYLERYFAGRGCRTVRVPPTLDVHAMPMEAGGRGPNELNLVCAGFSTTEELLSHVFDAMRRVDPRGTRVCLHLAGATERQVRRVFPNCPMASVKCYGHLPHPEMLAVIARCDFSVLVRPKMRFAQAGFSTKAVESLACGVPVLGNLTSNLGEYLSEGHNALICQDESVGACERTMDRALACRSRWPQMRLAARSTAERSFDYRSSAPHIMKFLWETTGRAELGGMVRRQSHAGVANGGMIHEREPRCR